MHPSSVLKFLLSISAISLFVVGGYKALQSAIPADTPSAGGELSSHFPPSSEQEPFSNPNEAYIPSEATPEAESEPQVLGTSSSTVSSRVAGIISNLLGTGGTFEVTKQNPYLFVNLKEDGTYFKVQDNSSTVLTVDYDKSVIVHKGSSLYLLGTLRDRNLNTGKNGQVLTAEGDNTSPIWKDQADLEAGNLECDNCIGEQEIEDLFVLNTGDTIHGDLLVGEGTFNNPSSNEDLYVTGNVEVDGTIHANVTGSITTGFTAGSIVFADSSGALAQDNASLFFDDTNNVVGIGTATPSTYDQNGWEGQLVVAGGSGPGGIVIQGEATQTLNGIRFASAGSNNATDKGFIYYDLANNALSFGTNRSTRVTINSTGLFGIGDTSPDYRLELHDASATPTFALSDDDVAHGLTTLQETDVFSHISSLSTTTGGTQWTSISDTNTQALSIRAVIGSTDPTDTTPAFKIIGAKSDGSTSLADLGAAETVFQVANNDDTAAITVLGDGKVGIGTVTPSAIFDSKGSTTELTHDTNYVTLTRHASSGTMGYKVVNGGFNGRVEMSSSTGNMHFINDNALYGFEFQNSTPTTFLSLSTKGNAVFTQVASVTGTPTHITVTGAAHTALTASTEATDVNFNLARTVQFATGALTTQRAMRIQAPTYGFVGASTITNAATVEISGAPVAGTNATITNAYALRVLAGQATAVPIVVQGAGSQSANLTEWRDSNDAVKAVVSPLGRIGIGVTAPGASLDVRDYAWFTRDKSIQLVDSSNTIIRRNLARFLASADTIAFGDTDNSGTAPVNWTFVSGNIGIGDTSPDDLLNVHSAAAASGIAITSLGTDTDAYLKFELTDGTANFTMGVDDSDSDKFKISRLGTLGSNDVIVIDDNNRVAIGKSTFSTYKLDIVGSVRITETGADEGLEVDATGTRIRILPYDRTAGTYENLLIEHGATGTTFDITNNIILGGTDSGTSCAKCLAIASSTAPSASITDGIQLFAVDIAGSHELRVRDEAGNVTTLSPHNFNLFTPQEDYFLPWAYTSERDNQAINVDMYGAIQQVELLSGKHFIYGKDLNTGDEFHPTKLADLIPLPAAITELTTKLTSIEERLMKLETTSATTESAYGKASADESSDAEETIDTSLFLTSDIFTKELTFTGPVTFKGQLTIQSDVVLTKELIADAITIASSLVVKGASEFVGEVSVNNTQAGFAKILHGATTVAVEYEKEMANTPLVQVTAQGETSAYWVSESTTKGFTLHMSKASAEDITFAWTALTSKNPTTAVSEPGSDDQEETEEEDEEEPTPPPADEEPPLEP